VNGQRVDAASRAVKPGDVVTVALDRTVRVMKVTGFAERRGDAQAAQALYQDLTERPASAPPEAAPPVAQRQPGAGRPTKHERRALDRLHGQDDE
jgi:ribosome-associated heat shock protein Hsp15